MPEAKTRELLRVFYVFCGVILAIATGSLIPFTLDQAIAGHMWWPVVFGFVGYSISKVYERLRLAMGFTEPMDIFRRMPWFGDWEAWIFSLSMAPSQ
jgi:hypothetical protein